MDEDLDAAALEVAALAAAAQRALDALVARNAATPAAIRKIQTAFNADFVQVMARHMKVATGDPWSVRQVGEMRVGTLTLSAKLYRNAQQTSNEVAAVIKEHAQGVMQARALAIKLYDGYVPGDQKARPLEGRARAELPRALRELTANPTDAASLQRVYDQGIRYASTLKTEPLKAAYMQAFEGWRKQEGMAALQKRLEVAHKEKTRYFANRIAQTELARAHSFAIADELMADDSIEVVQVLMSASHPRVDVCDMHAKANLFGLGPGVYPKGQAPRPIFHPFCRCRLRSRPDLRASDARPAPGGARAYLKELPEREAVRVMGSQGKLAAVMRGDDALKVLNRNVPADYRTVRLGEVGRQNVAVNRQQLEDFYFDRPGAPARITVAELTDADRVLFKTSAMELWLSRVSVNEHKAKHPEVGVSDYARLPELLRAGEVWAGPQDRRFVLLKIDGKPYRAALKIDKSGTEAWFLSLIYNEKQKPPKGAVRIR